MSDADQDPTRVDLTSVFAPDSGGPPTGNLPPVGPQRPTEPPAPDRRPWIVVALLAAIVVILLLVLVLGGDDGDGASTTTSSDVSTSTSNATTTTVSPTTSAPPTTATATKVTVAPATCAAVGKSPAKPGLVADTVYQAWVRGDQACAATLMTPDARAELFARNGADADDEFQGCTDEEVPDPHTDCAFTYEGGATHYLMRYNDAEGWEVYDITQVAD